MSIPRSIITDLSQGTSTLMKAEQIGAELDFAALLELLIVYTPQQLADYIDNAIRIISVTVNEAQMYGEESTSVLLVLYTIREAFTRMHSDSIHIPGNERFL